MVAQIPTNPNKVLDFPSQTPEPARRLASIEMEEGILGGILIDPAILSEVGDLTPAAFTSRTHRLIFSAILEVNSSGLRPDANTLATFMGNNKTLADAGGKVKLRELMERILHSGSVEQYAKLLQQDYAASLLSASFRRAANLADAGDIAGAEELLKAAREGKSGAANLRDRVKEIITESGTEAETQERLLDLHKTTGQPLQGIERLRHSIESETDSSLERDDAVLSLPNLLKSQTQEIKPVNYLWGDGGKLALAMTSTALAMPTACSMIFSTFIAASASRIGTSSRIVVKASAKYVQLCIFWIGIVSRSGTLKTPAQRVAIDPLIAMEIESKKAYSKAVEDYKDDKQNWKKGDPPLVEPAPRKRYVTKDSTLETIERLHGDNPRGMLYYRDELAGMAKSRNAFKPGGKGADLEAELDQWNGSPMIIDRKEREICLDQSAISRTGSTQWEVLQELAGSHDDSNGNLARWMFCAVKSLPRYLNFDNQPDTGIGELLGNLYQKLDLLPNADYLIDGDSQAAFKTWQNHLVDCELAEIHPGLRLVYPKIEAYTARLALWLHCVNAVLAGNLPAPSIPGSTMIKAIELASFFLGQARLIYAVNSPQSGLTGRLMKLYQFAEGKVAGINPRQVKANCRSFRSIPSTEIVRDFQSLVKDGFFRAEGDKYFAVDSVDKPDNKPSTPKTQVSRPPQGFTETPDNPTSQPDNPAPKESPPESSIVDDVVSVDVLLTPLSTPEPYIQQPSPGFVDIVDTFDQPVQDLPQTLESPPPLVATYESLPPCQPQSSIEGVNNVNTSTPNPETLANTSVNAVNGSVVNADNAVNNVNKSTPSDLTTDYLRDIAETLQCCESIEEVTALCESWSAQSIRLALAYLPVDQRDQLESWLGLAEDVVADQTTPGLTEQILASLAEIKIPPFQPGDTVRVVFAEHPLLGKIGKVTDDNSAEDLYGDCIYVAFHNHLDLICPSHLELVEGDDGDGSDPPQPLPLPPFNPPLIAPDAEVVPIDVSPALPDPSHSPAGEAPKFKVSDRVRVFRTNHQDYNKVGVVHPGVETDEYDNKPLVRVWFDAEPKVRLVPERVLELIPDNDGGGGNSAPVPPVPDPDGFSILPDTYETAPLPEPAADITPELPIVIEVVPEPESAIGFVFRVDYSSLKRLRQRSHKQKSSKIAVTLIWS